ncbi:unnamed protein product, partial [Discosporangium mesarthrocarpum]
MFLAAVARPRMISDGVWFDGKIGIWPIADTVAAMRSSKNRNKGTMVLKPATINAERYKELMIDKAWDSIMLETQPANSPDLNVNDLGFFHSIQQLKEDVGVSSPEDLEEATMEAFDVYPRETLERVWQSLFAVLGEVLGSKGNSSYKVPHLGEENLGRAGKLPVNGRVDEEKYRVGKAFGRLQG